MEEEFESTKPPLSRVKKITSIVLNCFLGLAIIFFLFSLTVVKVTVDGSSMFPTLVDKQVGYSDQFFYKLGKVKRFDIVVFNQNGLTFVKRVIGLPNEKVEYKDNVLIINDKPYEEKFLSQEAKNATCSGTYSTKQFCTNNVIVPSDEYFVLGDNRKASSDSRVQAWHIKKTDIVGIGFVLIGNCGSYTNGTCSNIKYDILNIKIVK
jgi:signal peptidase I